MSAFPQRLSPADLPDAVKGFKPDTLEVHLDRADRERTGSDWQQVARFGAEAAIAQWERSAAPLYSDPSDALRARSELTDWVGLQVQDRYESWLMARFFSRQGSLEAGAVQRAIADANLSYFYQTDSSGRVQLDDSGDPVLKGAADLAADRQAWQSRVTQAEETALRAWEQRVDLAFAPELAGMISPAALSKYQDCKIGFEDGLRREMEQVALQGELSFVSRRLYDQYSLRKKSESATADAIADQIARETKAQTDAGIRLIQAGLSLTPESTDSSIPTIDVEQWQQSFKAALEAGLSRWDDAEQKFLANRMEWERDAGKSYASAEKAWAAAFQRLQTERRAWEKQVDALLEIGAARWDQEQGDLSAAIDTARTEFQKERDDRVAAMQDKVGALVSLYAQTQQVLATARASGQALVNALDVLDSGGACIRFDESSVGAIENFRKQKWAESVSAVEGRLNDLNGQVAELHNRIGGIENELEGFRRFLERYGPEITITGPDSITVKEHVTYTPTRYMDRTTAIKGDSAWLTVTCTTVDTVQHTTVTTSSSTRDLVVPYMAVKYVQLSDQLTQARANLDGPSRQLTQVQVLLDRMSSADAGPFMTGERNSFVQARDEYEAYLRPQDSFGADLLVAEWEKCNRFRDWLDIISEYDQLAQATRQDLQETLGAAFGAEATDLRDVLKTDGGSGVAYLDEYQLELLRARGVQDYWTQKKAIADAVVAYAQDLTSGRQTQDQSEKSYQAAAAEYETRLAAYNQLIAELKTEGSNLTEARRALDQAQSAVDLASADHETAYKAYLSAMAAVETGTVVFYQDQIGQRYAELLAAAGMSAENAALTDAYTQYYAAARRHGYDLVVQEAWQGAARLLNGDPQTGVKSLAELKAEAQAVQVPSSLDEIPTDLAELGVLADSPYFTQVSALFSSWRDSATEDGRALAAWKLVARLNLLRADAEAACNGRVAGITVCGAADGESWYAQAGGRRTDGSLADRISADALSAQLALIAARASAETRGLQAWIDLQSAGSPSDPEALMLAQSTPADLSVEEARARLRELAVVSSLLEGREEEPAAAATRLRSLVEAGGWVQLFVAGSGTFVDPLAGDLCLALCAPQYSQVQRVLGLQSAWNESSYYSTALAAEREASALEAIRNVFSSRGFTIGPSGALPTSEEICLLLQARGAANATVLVASLGRELREATSLGPGWLAERIDEYTGALAGYAAAEAVRQGFAAQASANAKAAESAAEAARESQAGIRSLTDALRGSGRLASLATLIGRSDTPSAAAISARGLLVQSAAVQAARDSLADGDQTLPGLVASLMPGGAPAELVDDVVQKAQQVLQANSEAGAVGVEIAAYRAWNSTSISAAVSGVSVGPYAAEAMELWDDISSVGWTEQQAATAISSYLSKYSPGSAPDVIVQLCEELESGLEDHEAIFRRFLFGGEFDSLLESFSGFGAAGEAYKRAAALRIVSTTADTPEGRVIAGFLRDRTGVESAGDAQVYAGRVDFDLDAVALAGASDLSLEYLCKSLLAEGLSIPEEVAARLASAPSALAAVDDFRATLQGARGYIAALDGTVDQYVSGIDGDLGMRSVVAAAISTGQWSDEFFAARADGGYLNWLQGIADAALVAAMPAIAQELGQRSEALGEAYAQSANEAACWHRVENAARQASSWRDYLTPSNVGAEAVGSSSIAQTRDAGSFQRNPLASGNAALDAFNEVAGREAAVARQLGADPGTGLAITQFHEFLAKLISGTVPETDCPGPIENGLDSACSRLESMLFGIQGLKEDLLRSGEALTLLDPGTDTQRELARLRQAADSAEDLLEARQSDARGALAAFETGGQQYNALCDQFRSRQRELDEARCALRIQEEIRSWASNGYLSSSGEVADAYQSPVQQQQAAERALARATVAVDALKGLYGSAPVAERLVGDDATRAAYEAWEARYAVLLGVTRGVGQLEQATTSQAQRANDQFERMQQARESILNGEKVDQSLGLSWNPGAQNWASYLTFDGTGWLRLAVGDDFKLQSQSTAAQWQAVKDFFARRSSQPVDPPESQPKSAFERQMESWLTTMGGLSDRFGGMSALMDRWGLASDWLKRSAYEANVSAGQVLLPKYADDDTFLRSSDVLEWSLTDYSKRPRDFVPQAIAAGQSAYSQVMADSVERRAFEFYLAVRQASGGDNWQDQFDTRTASLALSALRDSMLSRARELETNASAPFGWITNAWTHWTDTANQLRTTVDTKIRGILEEFSCTLGSTLASAKDTFWQSAADYAAETRRLAELRGTDSATLSGIDSFMMQYRSAIAQESGVALDQVTIPSALEAAIRSLWDRLGAADKGTLYKALSKMQVLASADVESARLAVGIAAGNAQGEEQKSLQAYRAAFDAYLAGTGSQSDFTNAAQSALRNAAWGARAEQQLLGDTLQGVCFSGGAPLSNLEAAVQDDSMQQYAQIIASVCASALNSHGIVLEQEWDLALQDLTDRQQAWLAQVRLVQAKAASQWDASRKTLVQSAAQWKRAFQQQYAQRSEAWRLAYLGMGEEKLDWVQRIGQMAGRVGNEAILSEVGASADDSARAATTLVMPSLSFDAQDASLRVEALLGDVQSAQALSALRRMNAGIAESQVVVASSRLSVDTSGARIAAEVRRTIQNSHEELAAIAARGIADEAQQSVEQARKALTDSVKQANQGFERSMDETFFAEGYSRNSGEYRREAIVRSTFFETAKTQTQALGSYRWYAMPTIQIRVDLSQDRLGKLPAEAVMDLVGVAQQEVSQAQKKIFGEGKELGDEQKRSQGLVFDVSANGKTVTKEIGEGEFGSYIGYVPEFTDKPDFDKSQGSNIVVTGSGELGRLMGDFIWYQMLEQRGWSEMNLSAWDKPLWDDTGSWFKAPSVKTVGTIAAGLAASIIVPGSGAMSLSSILTSAAVSTSATFAFDSLDVMGGYKSWEDAGLDIGKSFLSSAASGVIGGVFNGFDPGKVGGITGLTGSFGQSAIGKAMLAGAQTFTTNVATSAINAIDLQGGWGIGFATDAFMNNSFGIGSIASTAGSMAGAYTKTKLGGMLDMAGNKFYGGAVSLAGGAATEIARYGTYVTSQYYYGRGGSLREKLARAYDDMGGVTLNVANAGAISDMLGTGEATLNGTGQSGLGEYAQRLANSGLVQMNIGSEGITGSFGTGGTDIMGGMYRLGKGSIDRAILENLQARDDVRGEIAMTAYVFGDWAAENTARRVGINRDQIVIGFDGAKGEIDENTSGYTQSNGHGGRAIFLKDMGGTTGALHNMAVTLQQEAYRDTIVNALNGEETYQAAKAHTLMAVAMSRAGQDLLVDDQLQSDSAALRGGDAAFRQYVNYTYDSSDEYWRVIKHRDGAVTMHDDNRDDVTVVDETTGKDETWLYDEWKKATGQTSRTAFIGSVLGLERGTVNSMMAKAGWSFDMPSMTWGKRLGEGIVAFTPEQAAKMVDTFDWVDSQPPGMSSILHSAITGVETAASWFGNKVGQGLDSLFNPVGFGQCSEKTLPDYEWLTDERIQNEDEAFLAKIEAEGWSNTGFWCNAIAPRDLMRNGYNPGMFDQDLPIRDAVAKYQELGLARDLPIQGTVGLIYYYRDDWQHVQHYEYGSGGLTVWHTPGNEPARPWKVEAKADALRFDYGSANYWKKIVVVPTDWVKRK